MSLYTHIETIGGLDITFEALPEYTPIADIFDDTVHDLDAMAADIDAGNSVYFCAKVSASKNGIELGSDYLGCCHYQSFEQFHQEKNGYYADMVEIARGEAIKVIEDLCAGVSIPDTTTF